MMGTIKKLALGIVALPIVVGCTGTLTPTQPAPTQPAPPPAQTAPAPVPAPNIPQPQPGQPDPEATQAPAPPQNASSNVQFLQQLYSSMTPEQQANIQNEWLNVKGDAKLEKVFLNQFTTTINDNGTVERNTGYRLTSGEARQFMEWTLTQG